MHKITVFRNSDFASPVHCVRYQNFTFFPSMEIMWKLCGNYVFPGNFHTRKLGEITVSYAAEIFKKHSAFRQITCQKISTKFKRVTRNFSGQLSFLEIRVLRKTFHLQHMKESPRKEKVSVFLLETFKTAF